MMKKILMVTLLLCALTVTGCSKEKAKDPVEPTTSDPVTIVDDTTKQELEDAKKKN